MTDLTLPLVDALPPSLRHFTIINLRPPQLTGSIYFYHDKTEFSVIKNHPLAGYDILKTIDFQMPIAKIVYQHHEKLDGSGYPQGLIGNEIMLEARIVNVADVVDAMISQRPYRSSQGIDDALEEIKVNAGILYDPEVVDVCLYIFNEKGFQFEEIKIRTAPR